MLCCCNLLLSILLRCPTFLPFFEDSCTQCIDSIVRQCRWPLARLELCRFKQFHQAIVHELVRIDAAQCFIEFRDGRLEVELIRIAVHERIHLLIGLEEIAHDIAAKSIKLAVHAGRKTIKAEDIKLAVRE